MWRFGTVSIDGTFAIRQFCYFVIHCMNATCALWPVYLNLRKVISCVLSIRLISSMGISKFVSKAFVWVPTTTSKDYF